MVYGEEKKERKVSQEKNKREREGKGGEVSSTQSPERNEALSEVEDILNRERQQQKGGDCEYHESGFGQKRLAVSVVVCYYEGGQRPHLVYLLLHVIFWNTLKGGQRVVGKTTHFEMFLSGWEA